jgi:hypothetical protein
MAKLQFNPLATLVAKGITSIVSGLKNASPGTIESVRATNSCWVAVNGDDTLGDGSISNPFATITRAVTLLGNGTQAKVIFLGPGSFLNSTLPVTNTTFIGCGSSNTILTTVGGGWSETSGPLHFEFVDLQFSGTFTGKNGGNFEAWFTRCQVDGTFNLVGDAKFTECALAPTLVLNNSTPTLLQTPGFSTVTISLNSGAGTNGNVASIEIDGGVWLNITFGSVSNDKPLNVRNAVIAELVTTGLAVASIAVGTTVYSLVAQDAGSQIVDASPYYSSKTYSGLGEFVWEQIQLTKTMPANAGETDVTLPMPRRNAATNYKTYAATTLNGVDISYVSSTPTTITVHVKPPSPTHASYSFSILVLT